MEYGICLLGVCPIRLDDDHRSEMVSQLLFGDLVYITGRTAEWLMVRCLNDDYEGWVALKQIQLLDADTFRDLQQSTQSVTADLIQVIANKTKGTSFLLSAGSTLYNCGTGHMQLLGQSYEFYGSIADSSLPFEEQLVAHALTFLHVPYMWGGKSALGIDCSGLSQQVYKMAGIKIPRDASQQAGVGETIHLIHESRAGDLLFFDNEEQHITHVGIMLDSSHIIHAHHQVRIDLIDHQGIYSQEYKKYTHKLRLIKRMSGV